MSGCCAFVRSSVHSALRLRVDGEEGVGGSEESVERSQGAWVGACERKKERGNSFPFRCETALLTSCASWIDLPRRITRHGTRERVECPPFEERGGSLRDGMEGRRRLQSSGDERALAQISNLTCLTWLASARGASSELQQVSSSGVSGWFVELLPKLRSWN